MNRPSRAIELLLTPLAAIYSGIMSARNRAFSQGYLKAGLVKCPVISIGNLTAGGTGKTPITALMVEELLARGYKPGLLSRGYGGSATEAMLVANDGTSESAAVFGDEMTWLAHRFPSVPAAVSRKRVAGAELLQATGQCQLIIADDAFQHRWLKREIDLIVLDATEPRWHYRSLPLGRMREGFASLERAKAVFITKTNLAERGQIDWLREQVAAFHLPIYEFESRIDFLSGLTDGSVEQAARFRARKILLVSGIGRPSTFKQLVFSSTRAEIVGHRIFGDHHSYSDEDFRECESLASREGASAIIVTEKDAVKMAGWRSPIPIFVSRLETRPLSDLGALYAEIDRLLI